MWKIVVFWKKEKQKSGVCECACQILFGEKQFVLMYEGVGKCSAIIALLMCFSFSPTTCKLKIKCRSWNSKIQQQQKLRETQENWQNVKYYLISFRNEEKLWHFSLILDHALFNFFYKIFRFFFVQTFYFYRRHWHFPHLAHPLEYHHQQKNCFVVVVVFIVAPTSASTILFFFIPPTHEENMCSENFLTRNFVRIQIFVQFFSNINDSSQSE